MIPASIPSFIPPIQGADRPCRVSALLLGLVLIPCLMPLLSGCASFDSQFPSSNVVAQVTGQFITAIEPIGKDKTLHFTCSLLLPITGPGGKTPVVGNLRNELAALKVGIAKELDDHRRGDLSKDELQGIINRLDEQYVVLDKFLIKNGIDRGGSLGDLLADQVGVNLRISFDALRQLRSNRE